MLSGLRVMRQTNDKTLAKAHIAIDWQNKVNHERLEVNDQALMGSDAPPEHFSKPQSFSVSISVASPDEAQRIFNGLAENGNVTMPFGKTFWSPAFGMTVDRFGIPWMVSCEPAAATT